MESSAEALTNLC